MSKQDARKTNSSKANLSHASSSTNPATAPGTRASGSALALTVGTIAALAGLGVLGATLYSRPSMNALNMVAAARARHAYAGEVTPLQLRQSLARAGFTPEPLAASGVDPAAVPALVAAARSALADGELIAADADTRKAQADVDRLRRAVSTGAATDQKAALDTALVALAAAKARAQTALDHVFTAATARLTDEQRAALVTIRTNQAWGLPTRYLAGARVERDWVTLRDALSNQRTIATLGDDQNPDLAAALGSADAGSATAQANLDAHQAELNATYAREVGI